MTYFMAAWVVLGMLFTGWVPVVASHPPLVKDPMMAMQLAHTELAKNELGESRWALETALRMAPRSDLIRASLQVLSPAIRGEPAPSIRNQCLDRLLVFTLSEWVLWVSIGWLGVVFGLMHIRWTGRWAFGWVLPVVWGGFLGIGGMGCLGHAWVWRYPRAIVVSDTTMRMAPSVTSGGIHQLYEGERVIREGTQGRWVLIRRLDNQLGWILAHSIWKQP